MARRSAHRNSLFSDADGNFFAAVNLQNDENVIQIDKYANASELYFFKLLMMADTNIAFGEELVVLDSRATPKFSAALKAANVKKPEADTE